MLEQLFSLSKRCTWRVEGDPLNLLANLAPGNAVDSGRQMKSITKGKVPIGILGLQANSAWHVLPCKIQFSLY